MKLSYNGGDISSSEYFVKSVIAGASRMGMAYVTASDNTWWVKVVSPSNMNPAAEVTVNIVAFLEKL